MIELKHLKTLLALKATGSVAAAAMQLHQTQSALSHQLSDIEQRLGYRLFIRKSYPLRFTLQGEILFNLAQKVLPEIHQALHTCQKPDNQLLRFAIECHSSLRWLAPVLQDLRGQEPALHVDFVADLSFDPKPALQRNEVDLVLTSELLPDNGLQYLPLGEYELKIIIAADHRLASKDRIMLEDLAKETVLVYPIARQRIELWHRYLQPAGIAPYFKSVNNILLMLQMVSANMGIAALPSWAVKEFEPAQPLVSLPFDKPLYNQLYAAIREGEQNIPTIQAFIRSFSETFNQHTSYHSADIPLRRK